MTFTDENGDKWETLPDDDTCLIKVRPIKVEPKKLEWTLALYAVGEFDLIRENYQLTKAQAQLIKQAVEKLMGYINLEISPSEIEHQEREKLRYAADKARNALKEGLHEV